MQIRRNIGIATYHRVVRRAGKIFTYTRPYKSGAQDADAEESIPPYRDMSQENICTHSITANAARNGVEYSSYTLSHMLRTMAVQDHVLRSVKRYSARSKGLPRRAMGHPMTVRHRAQHGLLTVLNRSKSLD